MRSVYDTLSEAGAGERVIIDMGLVHDIDYYTGLVFRGYMEGAGEPVLTGGRYDNLASAFGPDAPATGFAVNVSLAADTTLRQKGLPESEKPRYLVFFKPEFFTAAQSFVRENASHGVRCELRSFDRWRDLLLREKRGIRGIAIVDGEGVRMIERSASV